MIDDSDLDGLPATQRHIWTLRGELRQFRKEMGLGLISMSMGLLALMFLVLLLFNP